MRSLSETNQSKSNNSNDFLNIILFCKFHFLHIKLYIKLNTHILAMAICMLNHKDLSLHVHWRVM